METNKLMGNTKTGIIKRNVKGMQKFISWKPSNDDENIVSCNGGIFLIYFEKVLKAQEVRKLDRFLIKKNSYEKQLEVISRYVNYFMNFYDPDHELVTAYLKIKTAIDLDGLFNQDNPQQLIDLIYEVMFTDTVVKKVCDMVEDNYLDDIESGDSKRSSKETKYRESLEFTNHHIKILLRISFGMKCIAPILFHYVAINVIKLDKDSTLIYEFYKKLFDIFSDNVDIYNKLFTYVKAKVLEAKSHNLRMFEQRDILGNDEYTVIRLFLQKVLISENMVKYKFNEHKNPKTGKYKENIVGFNKTILKYQMLYYLKEQYPKTLTEVVYTKNSEGLSGGDKLEMNMMKIDEGRVIFSDICVEDTVKRIMRDQDFNITEDEIDYYIKYHKPPEFIRDLVYAYWGKYFGSCAILQLLTRREYICLLLILKKKLLSYEGYHECSEQSISFCRLPYILSGNLADDKISTRIIRNTKFKDKVTNSYLYKDLVNVKYKNLTESKPNYIQELLSQIINTKFTYVAYEKHEILGESIECNEDVLSDEVLFFLRMI